MPGQAPSFDLVVGTVDRTEELARFLDSVTAQDYPEVRVLVVDQNEDDRVEAVLVDAAPAIRRIRSAPGLSHARNAALPELTADVVAFPDDDCEYPPGLLARVADRLRDGGLDGLAGRTEDSGGRFSASWRTDAARLTDRNLWNRANAATVFLRRSVLERVGPFDQRLGLGSGTPWSSGEETDYLIRAVRAGARIDYDPTLVVRHDLREDDAGIGLRDGASLGFLLRKHGYPPRTVARMLVRPIGGAVLALLRLDASRARYYAATEVGRVRGYFAVSRSKSSA